MAMFLPSAVPCDGRKYLTRSHFASARAFSPTPPPSGDGLLGTCRALQSLLCVSPVSSPRRPRSDRLQSPLHIPSVPSTRRSQKVVKPEPKPSPPPRGANKRTRHTYEDEDGDVDMAVREPRDRFSTPKRQKRAPSDLPLGLAIADFESLEESVRRRKSPRLTPQSDADDQPVLPSIEVPDEGDASDWTDEDDQKLVEIVLQKLKLSKRDWEECARRIGKDNDSVGKRWRALVGEGNIGLRRGGRTVRGRVDECWQ
ncbi:hypothetical protein VTN77DRAFT_2931 [Rasamsonia byssochlamydoides]|uniref:uncharacterized protein n=1 Tax=Rasamsonia byssochlamydoides TaxID=89139 RepID=UPI0037446930